MIASGFRLATVILLALADPTLLAAQEWTGVQVERHSGNERWSGFLGLGYLPSEWDGIPGVTGVAGAIGVRGFTNGVRHRAFLELSVAQIATYATTAWAQGQGTTYAESRHDGRGVKVG